MKRPWIDILLYKVKELGEDPNTLVFDGDLRNIHQKVNQYEDGDYSNINLHDCCIYTKNYIYIQQFLCGDSYQQIEVIPRNPSVNAISFNDLNKSVRE